MINKTINKTSEHKIDNNTIIINPILYNYKKVKNQLENGKEINLQYQTILQFISNKLQPNNKVLIKITK